MLVGAVWTEGLAAVRSSGALAPRWCSSSEHFKLINHCGINDKHSLRQSRSEVPWVNLSLPRSPMHAIHIQGPVLPWHPLDQLQRGQQNDPHP